MENQEQIIAMLPEGATLEQFLRVAAMVAQLQPDEYCKIWQEKLEKEVCHRYCLLDNFAFNYLLQ